MDYFELLKGSGGKKEQGGWFSNLLVECRDSEKKIKEGIWSWPETEEKAQKLLELMKNPISPKEGDEKLYDLLGNDTLFDAFNEAEDNKVADVRPEIKSYVESKMDWFVDHVKPEAFKILQSMVESKKVNEQGGSKKKEIKEEIVDKQIPKGSEVDYHGRTGVVKSYDSGNGYYRVYFSDVDREELLDEIELWDQDPAAFESKKVNELDEPDLERPEKARKGKRPLRPVPKRKRPRRPEPDVDDREPKEEPRPKPKKEPKEEPREKPEVKPVTPPEEVPEIGSETERDDVPPPPEEVKPAEQPIEMRKEYLGRSDDTHYYFVTLEGEGGVIEDLVIADQEGVKKYSAKEKDIEVTEENIADFIIQAIRDIQILQIERSIFMKYVYPQLEKMGPEEDMLEEPEEEEDELGKEKKPFGQEEEERRPRESKINDSVDEKFITLQEFEEFMEKCDKKKSKSPERVGDRDKTEHQFESKNLIETQVIDGVGNEFDVNLADDGTSDAVININGREFRFSGEFAVMWRDEHGGISEEGLEELALDALAMMEEDEYQELLAKNAPEEEIDDTPKSRPGETDWPLKARPEPEKGEDLSAPPIAPATDDVDVSKADVVDEPDDGAKKSRPPKKYPEEEQEVRRKEDHAAIAGQPKYRPKKPVPDQPEGGLANKENEKKIKETMRWIRGQDKKWYEIGPEDRDFEHAMSQEDFAKMGQDQGAKRGFCPPGTEENENSQENENKENENVKGENEMNKTAKDLLQEAEGLEAQAAELRKEADVLAEKDSADEKKGVGYHEADPTGAKAKKEKEDREKRAKKDEGIAPDPKASQEDIIKKLLEAGITETDVAKGTKALVLLAKEALKAGDYAKLGEFAIKLAEIEAMIPVEAEAEVKDEGSAKKDDKEGPEKKDGPKKDEPKKDEPKKDELVKDDGVPEIGDKEDKEKGADEKKSPPHCDKCDKAHWPFDKCSESEEVVDEAKKDAEAKAKKEKEEKEKKAKKEKEDKAKKDKKEKEAKAKAKAKKESKIPVEKPDEDLSESKSIASLKNLLDMSD